MAGLEKLKDFVITENSSLELIERFLQRNNYMEVFGIAHHELSHSNFLAWLLQPTASHNLGSYFLKKFLNLIETIPAEEKIKINLSDLDETAVWREYKQIDLVIYNEALNLCICIENKIKSGKSRADQLTSYYQTIENQWPSGENQSNYYIYLTPFARALGEEEINLCYENITYREILGILEEIRLEKLLSTAFIPLLDTYIENLKNNILMDNDTIKLAQKIYRKHSAAINFIVKNKTNLSTLFKDINTFLINSDKYINITPSHNSIIRFLPQEIATCFDYNNSWGGETQRTNFALEIFCNIDAIWVKFCFGKIHGENKEEKQALKNKYFEMMKGFSSLKGYTTTGSKPTSNWVTAARYTIMKTSDDSIYDYDSLLLAFQDKFQQFEQRVLEEWRKEVQKNITKTDK